MGLWSFLRGIWPRRRRPPSATPSAAPPTAADSDPRVSEEPGSEAFPRTQAPAVGEPAEAAAASCADEEQENEEQENEDDGWDDEDEDPDGPDPFISAQQLAPEPLCVDLERRRAEARARALAGEHRIFLSMPAGPGSLAEALNQLSAEGLVEAQFVEDGEGEPHILYRPLQ